MSWFAAVGAIAVATALVLVPGLGVTIALRLKGLAALALAGPVGYALVGVSGVLFDTIHVRFGWWSPVSLAIVAVLVIVAVRLLLGRRRTMRLPAWDTWSARQLLPVVGAVVIASVVIGVIAFGAVPFADRISQTYDAVFHLDAAAFIKQTGDASSLKLYTLVHPTRTTSFYPAVWHSLVAVTSEVTGVSIPAATNAVWIATAGPVWSLGCALLAGVLFGRVSARRSDGEALPLQRTAVAATAALLASGFAAFPFILLDFGTLYPNGLSYTLLPTGLALFAAVLPWPTSAPWQPEALVPRWRVGLLLAVWLLGAFFAHPRSVVGLAALAAPLAVAWFASRMRSLAATGERGRRRARWATIGVIVGIIVVAVLALLFVLHYYDVGKRPISDHLNGGPARAKTDFVSALLQGLLSTTLISPSQLPLPVPIVLAVVVLGGLVALLFRPGLRWTVASYLVVVVLYAAAAGSNSDIAKLATGLWDKDKFRIIALLPTIAVPIAAWTVVAAATEIARLAQRRRARSHDARPAIVIVLVAVVAVGVACSAWFGASLGGVQTSIGRVFALPLHNKDGKVVDADEVALLESLPKYVPAGQIVLGDPWNGSALAWAIGDRQTLFPHLGGYWGTTRATVAKHLNAWQTNPAVGRGSRTLDLHWLVADPALLWHGNPQDKTWVGIRKAIGGPGLKTVAQVGSTKLYRITACW